MALKGKIRRLDDFFMRRARVRKSLRMMRHNWDVNRADKIYRSSVKRGYLKLEQHSATIPYDKDTLNRLDDLLINQLRLSQFHTSFDETYFLISSADIYNNCGFGASVLRNLIRVLMWGTIIRRTAVFDETPSLYDFCFEPIGIHSYQDVRNRYGPNRLYLKNFHKENIQYFSCDSKWWATLKKHPNPNTSTFVTPLQRMPYSYIYFAGLILDSFLVLKQEYNEHIMERMNAIGLQGPIIGAHIRQGDVKYSPLEAFRRYTPSEYFRMIEGLVEKTGIKTVFIATDSDKVIEQLPRDSGITFLYDGKEKRYDNLNCTMIAGNPTKYKNPETMTAVKNLYMLGSCDYILGTSGSNMMLYAAAIGYFRKKRRNMVIIRGKNCIEYITDDEHQSTQAPPLKRLGFEL